MIIQIRSFEDEEIQALITSTGMKTAAGAFGHAARQYDYLVSKVDSLSDTVSTQRMELRRLREVLESARFAAAQLVDKTSQQDLEI